MATKKMTTLQELQKLQRMMKETDAAEKTFNYAWSKYIEWGDISEKRGDTYMKKRYAEQEYAKKLQDNGTLRYFHTYVPPLQRQKKH